MYRHVFALAIVCYMHSRLVQGECYLTIWKKAENCGWGIQGYFTTASEYKKSICNAWAGGGGFTTVIKSNCNHGGCIRIQSDEGSKCAVRLFDRYPDDPIEGRNDWSEVYQGDGTYRLKEYDRYYDQRQVTGWCDGITSLDECFKYKDGRDEFLNQKCVWSGVKLYSEGGRCFPENHAKDPNNGMRGYYRGGLFGLISAVEVIDTDTPNGEWKLNNWQKSGNVVIRHRASGLRDGETGGADSAESLPSTSIILVATSIIILVGLLVFLGLRSYCSSRRSFQNNKQGLEQNQVTV